MRALSAFAATANCRKLVLGDRRTHALSRDQALRIVGIQQKRRELFTAKSRPDVARAQCLFYDRADFFQRFTADQMPVSVVHLLKIIDVHHQHTEGHRFGFGTGRFPAQLRKERFAGQQAGKFIVDQQPVNLLLKFAVDFIEHFEANQLIANDEFVAVLQKRLVNGVTVQHRAVG